MSMRTAITGLNAAQTELSTIANNIANAATAGFKASRVEFADVFSADASGRTPGSGVRVTGITQMMRQGGLESTGNTLDLAINGNGFFMVRDGDAVSYTRAGNFRVDTVGNIATASGDKVQFYSPAIPLQYQTNDTALKTPFKVTGQQQITSISVATDTSTSQKTLTVNGGLPINIQSGDDPDARVRAFTLVNSINSKGISGLTAYVDPADATKVSLEYSGSGTVSLDKVTNNASTAVSQAAMGTRVDSLVVNQPLVVTGQQISSIAVDTDTVTGQKTITVNGNTPINISSGNDANASVRALALVESINGKNIPGVTAFVDPADNTKVSLTYSGNGPVALGKVSTATSNAVSGSVVTGTFALTRTDIDSLGIVRGTYANGEIRALGQVVVANFSTPSGLSQLGNTSWGATFASGAAQLNIPGAGDRGIIESGTLEASNVEITEQLVDMITAQRNFQANAKTISTADQVAQAVLNIR